MNLLGCVHAVLVIVVVNLLGCIDAVSDTVLVIFDDDYIGCVFDWIFISFHMAVVTVGSAAVVGVLVIVIVLIVVIL